MPLRLLLSLALGLGLLSVAAPAHADDDSVRDLRVSYEVRADGSVGVTYEIDWEFAEEGSHGIEFGIVTAEPWDDDPTKLAAYEISDLEVSSPSGAPAEFEETEQQAPDGFRETLLRIGDPDEALETREASYVISYDVTGLLRTYDSGPELHTDVTSSDFPHIERFSIDITAEAGAIPDARCLAGATECDASLGGGQAALGGDDVPPGDIVTAVAALPEGQESAEPDLRDRELLQPVVVRADTDVEVDSEGIAHFTLTAEAALPEGQQYITLELPTRRRDGVLQDRLYEVLDLTATDTDGNPLEAGVTQHPDESVSDAFVRYGVAMPRQHGGRASVVVSWSVAGAVDSDGDTAVFEYPLKTIRGDRFPAAGSYTWRLPAEPDEASCTLRDDRSGDDCALDGLEIAGQEVSYAWDGDAPGSLGEASPTITLPASAVGHVDAPGELSRDSVSVALTVAGYVGGVALLILATPLGRLVGVVRLGARDERYADAPPGETGGAVTQDVFRGQIPRAFRTARAGTGQGGLRAGAGLRAEPDGGDARAARRRRRHPAPLGAARRQGAR